GCRSLFTFVFFNQSVGHSTRRNMPFCGIVYYRKYHAFFTDGLYFGQSIMRKIIVVRYLDDKLHFPRARLVETPAIFGFYRTISWVTIAISASSLCTELLSW